MPYMLCTSENHRLGRLGTKQCSKDHTGQACIPLLPPPTLSKWAGQGLSPGVRKTVIYNVGGRWNRGDYGTKGAKYSKHLL